MEVTDFKSEVRIDFRGRLEAAMESEATKMAVRSNMHMDTGVVEDADFKSEVKIDSKVVWRPQWPQKPPKWQLEAICTWIPG